MKYGQPDALEAQSEEEELRVLHLSNWSKNLVDRPYLLV